MIDANSLNALKKAVDWERWPILAEELLGSQDEGIIFAFSGGADSVFLLLAAYLKYPEHRGRFCLFHGNHGLRGSESDGDEGFSREFASALGLSIKCFKRESGILATDEASLRNWRLGCLKEVAENMGGKVVFTGHHATDLVEWGIMQMIRGTGPKGLASPRQMSSREGLTFIRPLLRYNREEIRNWLTGAGIRWREDSSNEAGAYTRNKVRLDVLPVLRKSLPQDLERGYWRTRQLMLEADELIESIYRSLKFEFGDSKLFDGSALRGQPTVIWRRAFMDWLDCHFAEVEIPKGELLDQLLSGLMSGRQMSVNFGILNGFPLRFQVTAFQVLVDEVGIVGESPLGNGIYHLYSGDCLFFPDGKGVRIEEVGGEKLRVFLGNPKLADSRSEVWLDAVAIKEPLWIRHWLPGDRFCPLGAPGEKKLQDWFVDRKWDSATKCMVPVVGDGTNRVIWVPGFAPADFAKVSDLTEKALRLTYRNH